MMRISTLTLIALAGLLVAGRPSSAEAQEPGTLTPAGTTQVLSANPFLLLWEWANLEYERKISPTGTLGVAGSWLSVDDGDTTYKNLAGFYRHYPQGAALTGFYLGGRFGIYHGSDDDDSGHAFGLGIDVGYSWLLGAERSFYVGLGIGATRLFGGDFDDGSVTLPSIRLLNVGFSF